MMTKIFICSGVCAVNPPENCNCQQYHNRPLPGAPMPPCHDGCTCYVRNTESEEYNIKAASLEIRLFERIPLIKWHVQKAEGDEAPIFFEVFHIRAKMVIFMLPKNVELKSGIILPVESYDKENVIDYIIHRISHLLVNEVIEWTIPDYTTGT
jgi:hypothetical protein